MKIHHIGYLVEDIHASIAEMAKLGFVCRDQIFHDDQREIFIVFMENVTYMVELIQPINEKSSMHGLLKKYKNSPYHICYETKNISLEIENLSVNGYMLIKEPQVAPAIGELSKVAFLMHSNIGMIELVEI